MGGSSSKVQHFGWDATEEKAFIFLSKTFDNTLFCACIVWVHFECGTSDGPTSSVFCQYRTAQFITDHMLTIMWYRFSVLSEMNSYSSHWDQLWPVTSLSLSLSLSLRFNTNFPGEPGLAGVYWSKGWWRWWWQLDYWSYKSCKAPFKSSPPTNQHPVFLQAGCPSCCPTNSVKALKGNITFHGLAYPKLTWGSSNFVSNH